MYSREDLQEKTNHELRAIAKKMEIPGMSKKRKDIIVDAILEEQAGDGFSEIDNPAAKQKVTGIEFNAVSKTKDPNGKYGDKTETWCRISSGATSQQFDVAGYTVGAVMEFMNEVLNVEKNSSIIVNGESADGNYVIQAGDNIEFIKPAGSKG